MAGARRKPNTRGGKFQGWFMDAGGGRTYFTGTCDRAETLATARKLEDDHRQIRLGYREAPKSASKHKARPFAEAIQEFMAWGEACGGKGGRPWSKVHARMRRTRLTAWAERLNLQTLGDLDGSLPRVEAISRERQAAGRTGKTLSNDAESLKSFCRWAERRGYLDHDPLKGMTTFDCTPRSIRRAMTREEFSRLLAVAPEDRQLVYAVALSAGLRAGELKALLVSDLNLAMQSLNLRPDITKNRKPGLQPLPAWLMERLQEAASGKDADAPLLRVPGNQTQTFDVDLKNSGIPKWTPEGKLDFHALRVAFVSFLLESGLDVKAVMTLARHSTPDLTVNRYGRARRERLVEGAETVGAIARMGMESTGNCATSVLPKVACLASGDSEKGFMVPEEGVEPSWS